MNVGILGCGTIGGGVLDLIDKLPKESNVKVVKVFDLPSKKEMLGERFCDSIDEICESPDVDVVVEAMGGDKFPYECIVKALKMPKSCQRMPMRLRPFAPLIFSPQSDNRHRGG